MGNYKSEISQEEFEEIEHYLLNMLSSSHREEFERRMALDPALRGEVELQRWLMTAVELDSFEKSLNRPSVQTIKTGRFRTVSVWMYAAISVGLVVSGYVIWVLLRAVGPASNTGLYAAYFYPDPGLPVVMSSTGDYEFYDGMVSYKEGHYPEALNTWNKILEDGNDQVSADTLTYFMGMAALNVGNSELAKTLLDQVIQLNSGEFHDKATWYRALIYLKEGERTLAIALLEKISNRPDAKELLDELRTSAEQE